MPALSSHEGGGAWPGGLGGGCPSGLRSASLFGNGQYSANIIQGGSVLWPDVNGVITITGAATVAPDAETYTAFAQGHTLVLNGAGASLAPSVFCKGLILAFKVVRLLNGAKLFMTQMGYPGVVVGTPNLLDLIPSAYRSKFKPTLRNYELNPVGADGGLGSAGVAGQTGANATGRTGGGGAGGVDDYTTSGAPRGGHGAAGTCFCGGSGGGGGANYGGALPAANGGDAAAHGGQGGNAGSANWNAGGGAGRPAGARTTYTGNGSDTSTAGGLGAGGLLVVLAELLEGASGNTIESKGANGGACGGGGYAGAGGGSGGGLIYLLTKTDTFAGTVTAAGGLKGAAGATRSAAAGDGGVGSIVRTSGLS